MAKKDDFPNNWERFKKMPAEMYKSIPYDEFIDWRVHSWDLPDSISCIIRVCRRDTGKIKEFVYKTGRGANEKLQQLALDPLNEITIADNDEISLIRASFDDLIDDIQDGD